MHDSITQQSTTEAPRVSGPSETMSEPPSDGQLTVHHDEISQADIDRIERDHAIASESDAERTEAAQDRAGADALRSVIGRSSEVANALVEPTEKYTDAVFALNDGYRKKYDPENDPLSAEVEDAKRARDTAERDLDLPPLFAPDGEMPIGVTMQEVVAKADDENPAGDLLANTLQAKAEVLNRSAEAKDQLAERIEEWAGILHDNSPSQAFRDKYSHMDMSARRLAVLEQQVMDAERAEASELAELQSLLDSPNILFDANSIELDELFEEDGQTLQMPQLAADKYFSLEPNAAFANYYGRDSEEYENWRNLSTKDGATIDEARAMYREAVMKQAKPISEEYKIKRAFLDDIRYGRAAHWQ